MWNRASYAMSVVSPPVVGTHSWSATSSCPSTCRWAAGTPAAPGGASAPSPGKSPSGRWARRGPRPGSPAAWTPAPAATGTAGPPAGCSLERRNKVKRKTMSAGGREDLDCIEDTFILNLWWFQCLRCLNQQMWLSQSEMSYQALSHDLYLFWLTLTINAF